MTKLGETIASTDWRTLAAEARARIIAGKAERWDGILMWANCVEDAPHTQARVTPAESEQSGEDEASREPHARDSAGPQSGTLVNGTDVHTQK